MTNLPLVTIVTPSYKQAEFLEQTIQSVLSQDYPNIEYFVVDGGSKDGSVDIIQKYADRISWWVSEKDSGQAEAINKGFARAGGEIVGWINSDDYYLPGAISSAVAALQAHPECALVYGDVISVDASGDPFNVITYGNWNLDDLAEFNIIGQPSVFMRRQYLEEAGYLDQTYNLMLDHQLWLKMVQLAPMAYVPQRWSAARYHSAAKNVSQAPGYGPDAFRIIGWMPTQPKLADCLARRKRRIWAGAHRIHARYLLDGGLPGPAFKAYMKGLWSSPAVVLPEYRRILFAAASMVINVDGLKQSFLEKRRRKVSAELTGMDINQDKAR
jgi:glycosyltransferase involved in cell wall biosynthesis